MRFLASTRRWLTQYGVPPDEVDLVQDVIVPVVREVSSFVHSRRRGAFRSWMKPILIIRLRKYWGPGAAHAWRTAETIRSVSVNRKFT